ncbi:MAG: hypothetical protein R3C44_23720 [Chloroflexota bacterium]
MLGVPEKDHIIFHQWSDAIAHSLDLTEDEDVHNRASVAAEGITEYLAGLLAERRITPEDDLLSLLVAVEDAGDRLFGRRTLCNLRLTAHCRARNDG